MDIIKHPLLPPLTLKMYLDTITQSMVQPTGELRTIRLIVGHLQRHKCGVFVHDDICRPSH